MIAGTLPRAELLRRPLTLGSDIAVIGAGALLAPALVPVFVVGALLFLVLEAAIPARHQPPLRQGLAGDVAFFFTLGIGTTLGTALVRMALAPLPLDGLHRWTAHTPLAAQLALMVASGELGVYWSHRACHRVPLLWRFHAVHHSTEVMDWLSFARFHPVDEVVLKAGQLLPLLVLGIPVPLLAVYYVVISAQDILIHANIDATYGPLGKVIASPHFHRWHHVNDPAMLDINFAPNLALCDRIFGTFRMPQTQPPRLGVDALVPEGWLAQMAQPFRV